MLILPSHSRPAGGRAGSLVAHPERARRDSDGPPPREVQACPFAWVFFVIFVFWAFFAWWTFHISVRTDHNLVDGPSHARAVLDGAWKKFGVTLHVWCTGLAAQILGSPFLFMAVATMLACMWASSELLFLATSRVLQIGMRGARAAQRAPAVPLTALSIFFGMLHLTTAAPVLPGIRLLNGATKRRKPKRRK